jgi:hypothetical protein
MTFDTSSGFDPQRFATNSAFTLELDKLILKNDQQTCETSSGYIAKNLGMWSWGCLIVPTTNKLPVGLENVFPLSYKFTAELENFAGKVLIGETPLQRLLFYANTEHFDAKMSIKLFRLR